MAQVMLRADSGIPSQGGAGEYEAQLNYEVCTNSTDPQVVAAVLSFDPTTPEMRMWHFEVPESYDNSSSLTVRIWWKTSVITGNADFEVKFRPLVNDEPFLSTDWSTGQAANLSAANGYTADDIIEDEITCSRTDAGTPSAGEYITFLLYRDADDGSNDTLAQDAEVLGVTIDFPESA